MNKLIDKLGLTSFMNDVIYKNDMKALVVGSLALNLLGFVDSFPNDVDLEVKLSDSGQEQIFKLLSNQYGNNYYKTPEYKEDLDPSLSGIRVTWNHKPYIFEWRGVKYNVWIVDDFSHDYVTLSNGLNISKVMSVLKTKMSYGRDKDVLFISNIAKNLLSLIQLK